MLQATPCKLFIFLFTSLICTSFRERRDLQPIADKLVRGG
jgi:hypothetical protein